MARSDGGDEDAAEVRDDERVGRTIGKYTLARVIGRGGMGIVFEALNTSIGKRVAIKLVSAELAKNKDAVKRFQREAQAASAVESAHIVDIFDAGVGDDGVPYIVMELLRGEDLGHRIKRLGRLDLEDALHVTVQILRGLARAHHAGIVHRDLKPDNIFLVDRDDDDSFVKILDFGISKVARQGETPVQTLTKQGTVLGTPFYMAPEQAQGLPDTDGRADLWSTGAILYECLTGRAPHTGASYEQVIVNICSKDAADVRAHNPGVPEPVAKVIAKALARDRDDRFAGARDFLEALVIASGGVVTSGPRSSDEPSDPFGAGRVAVLPGSGNHRRISSSGGTVRMGSGDHGSIGSGDHAKAASGAHSRPSASGFDDTLEMKSGGPSRVGWATSGGAAVRRDRRRVLAMTLGALGLASVVTIAVALRKPGDPGARTNDAIDHRPSSGEGHGSAQAVVQAASSPSSASPSGDLRDAPAAGAQGSGAGAPPPEGSTGPVKQGENDPSVPRSKTAAPRPTSAPTAKASATAVASVTPTVAPVTTSAPTAPPASTPTLTIKRD